MSDVGPLACNAVDPSATEASMAVSRKHLTIKALTSAFSAFEHNGVSQALMAQASGKRRTPYAFDL